MEQESRVKKWNKKVECKNEVKKLRDIVDREIRVRKWSTELERESIMKSLRENVK